jgi:hypothetical protein
MAISNMLTRSFLALVCDNWQVVCPEVAVSPDMDGQHMQYTMLANEQGADDAWWKEEDREGFFSV